MLLCLKWLACGPSFLPSRRRRMNPAAYCACSDAQRHIVHVSRGANIYFSLAEASCILFYKGVFASNRVCDRCTCFFFGFFFLFCFSSALFWNVDRFEVGEFTHVTQTRLFVMVWLAGWRHGKLYMYIAASCVSWMILVLLCYTRGKLQYIDLSALWPHSSSLTSLSWCHIPFFNRPYCVKHRVLIFIKGLFKKKKKKNILCIM